MWGLERIPIARVSNCTIPLLDDTRLISSLFLFGSTCRLYSLFIYIRSERASAKAGEAAAAPSRGKNAKAHV